MHLHSIRLINFDDFLGPRTIAPSGELPLKGVTLVLGPNSSGKTSLLEIVEIALSPELGDEYGRSVFRSHQEAFGEVIVTADLKEGSSDVELLGQVRPLHPRYSSVAEIAGSIAGLPFPQALALTVYESNVEHGYQIDLSMAELKALADTGILEVVFNPEGELEVAIALPVDSDKDSDFLDRILGVFPAHLTAAVLPPVAVAPAELTNIGTYAEARLRSLVDGWIPHILDLPPDDSAELPGSDPWVVEDEAGGVRLAPGLLESVEIFAAEIRRLLPPFVAREGHFTLLPLSPAQWSAGSRLLAGFENGGDFRRAEAFGSGTRRRILTAMVIAARRLRQWTVPELDSLLEPSEEDPFDRAEKRRNLQSELWLGGGLAQRLSRVCTPPLLLIDEPEMHLHPDAQREIANWLSRGVSVGDIEAALVTSHSPSMLGIEADTLNLVLLRREEHRTRIEWVQEDVLETLDQAAFEQGLGREAWFFATRAVLLVEGEHDLRIIEHFFGRLLSTWRVRILALRGASNVRRLLDSEFLGASGLPLFVLLDNLLVERIRTATEDTDLTDEERLAASLVHQAERDDIRFLSYPEPDILCALPLEAVGRRYPNLSGAVADLADQDGYWSRVIGRWRSEVEASGKRVAFKKWVATEIFSLKDGNSLPMEALAMTREGDQPSPALVSAMTELEAHLADADLWR